LLISKTLLAIASTSSNLDIYLREDFMTFLKKINEIGITIFFVSHYLEEVEAIANKVLLINKGDILMVEPKSLSKTFKSIINKHNQKWE
jgi:ABC-2 type transport system ATP-binding protein